jgi:hypothetical protein
MSGGDDPVVVKLLPGGSHVWSKRVASRSNAYNYGGGVAFDSTAAALVAGSFSGTIDISGTQYVGGMVNRSYDAFLAKFAP